MINLQYTSNVFRFAVRALAAAGVAGVLSSDILAQRYEERRYSAPDRHCYFFRERSSPNDEHAVCTTTVTGGSIVRFAKNKKLVKRVVGPWGGRLAEYLVVTPEEYQNLRSTGANVSGFIIEGSKRFNEENDELNKTIEITVNYNKAKK